jgi:hypothetical protein
MLAMTLAEAHAIHIKIRPADLISNKPAWLHSDHICSEKPHHLVTGCPWAANVVDGTYDETAVYTADDASRDNPAALENRLKTGKSPFKP